MDSFGYWRMDKYDQLENGEDHLANIAKMKNLETLFMSIEGF